ncbi:MAG: glutamate 5-kinase, partial [Clostridia bacterium]|nr:glutamate 5-kinase [Clostridia bacterium]
VILSDIDGLYTADPHKDKNAVRIERVRELTPEIMALGGGEGSSLGTGGMRTKLHAAEICMAAGVDTVIASGEDPTILYKLVAGESVGTLFGGKK